MHRSTKTLRVFQGHLKRWREQTRDPGLTVLLIIEAALIFLVIPLAGMGAIPAFIVPAMFVLWVLGILVVTLRSTVAAIAVVIAVALSPFGAFVHAEDPSLVTEWLSAGGRMLAIAALSIVIAQAVFGPGRVTLHRVQGAVLLYLNFALFFFAVYRLLDVLVPNAFHGLPAKGAEFGSGAALLYFSFTTLTTLGYGDITPLHPLARNLANLEAVIGQLYPVTLLARLVSIELEHRRQSKAN
jgi:Ion channel